jgi:ATP-binding cassette subfamily G (WHITE) protein 2 (SNQ2)
MTPPLLSSTRGLDASTALEFIRALRIATDIVRVTTIVSLYQAGEQLYNHFDKVCVINEGKMAYFGPAKDARHISSTWVTSLVIGKQPPISWSLVSTESSCSDLQIPNNGPKVTDPSGRKIRPGYEGTVPRTANDMASYFKNSRLGQLNRSSLDSYLGLYVNRPAFKKAYNVSAVSEYARHAPESHAYMLSVPMQVRAVMRRRWQILKGDWVTQAVQLGQVFRF